ncbi:MAG: hypothetical protein KA191_12275 [Verrucomicrobia bacterium]|nr:hypothetical protein [Verrucomicrobiota bacterium]MDI9379728.1 hypothetical protein [Verrucomicrobiota bacterium]NMD19391.1 hypothetical protein [Verrucomicrobiota bacterium]HNU99752.1 hypothetical protein [Verrucomicrobiota bacterium]HOA61968.1 hypothetical protein [Verrucomicrobiota bacterium]
MSLHVGNRKGRRKHRLNGLMPSGECAVVRSVAPVKSHGVLARRFAQVTTRLGSKAYRYL